MMIDVTTRADLVVAAVRLRRARERGDELIATTYRKRIGVLLDRILETSTSGDPTG